MLRAGNLVLPKSASVIINKQSLGNLEEPRAKRKAWIVGCAAAMDPKEEFLVEIVRPLRRVSTTVEEVVSTGLVAYKKLIEGSSVSMRLPPHEVLFRDPAHIARVALPIPLRHTVLVAQWGHFNSGLIPHRPCE